MQQPENPGLEDEVRELERRLSRIERELGLAGEARPAFAAAAPGQDSAIAIAPAGLLPMAGRALLGLAGAYLLRALTESGALPPRGGVWIGILYAFAWLAVAARTPAAQRVQGALHSLTSALALAPLLWEATRRFHALSTWAAAWVLLVYTIAGLAIAWRRDIAIIGTVTVLTGLATASALLLETRDAVPDTTTFLGIAVAVEVFACLGRRLSVRWVAAAGANLSVLLSTWLVTNARGLPEGYAPISHAWLLGAQISLLAIYLSSIGVRTLLRHSEFSVFEIAQCALAFTIVVSGGRRLAAGDPWLGPAFALLALACGLACYAISFIHLDRGGERHDRNFYAYSTFGILLTFAGSWLLLSGRAAFSFWPAAAITCCWLGGRFRRLTLQAHGSGYLLLSLAVSGALARAAAMLLGGTARPEVVDTGLALGAVAAGCCYALAVRYGRGRPGWNFEFVRLWLAAMLAWVVSGTAATLAVSGFRAALTSDAYSATLRTAIIVGAALALAWAGSRWSLPEFERLIYPAMALGAYRLLIHDLHQDRTAALFLSLLVYGTGLIALPRVRRAMQPSAAAARAGLGTNP